MGGPIVCLAREFAYYHVVDNGDELINVTVGDGSRMFVIPRLQVWLTQFSLHAVPVTCIHYFIHKEEREVLVH